MHVNNIRDTDSVKSLQQRVKALAVLQVDLLFEKRNEAIETDCLAGFQNKSVKLLWSTSTV